MPWQNHWEDGVEYSIEHLQPFVHTFRRGGGETGKPLEEYHIAIEFSNHCFTAFDNSKGDDTLLSVYAQSIHGRRFSLRRYELSKRLPDIIRSLPKARCLNTDPDYLVLDLSEEDKDGRYEIYFKVIRTGQGVLRLIVKSAYFRTSDKAHRKPHSYMKINFFTLLHKAK